MNSRKLLPKAFDMKGRVAVITGGSGLLGVQHALALAELGASIVLLDINLENREKAVKKIRQKFGNHSAREIYCDVSKKESVENALAAILSVEKKIDVLINNAAIDPKVMNDGIIETSRLENFPLEQWNDQISVGLTGAFLCSQVFGSWMAKSSGGIILNIASDLSVFAPDQRIYQKLGVSADQQPVKPISYSVIKNGLIGMTRYLATYWNEDGVRVNALSPGGVYNNQDDNFVKKLTELIPMGRMAEPSEYASAIQFLCSDASSYMTGQNIIIDGGRSVW